MEKIAQVSPKENSIIIAPISKSNLKRKNYKDLSVCLKNLGTLKDKDIKMKEKLK